jgi:hypothetical protein
MLTEYRRQIQRHEIEQTGEPRLLGPLHVHVG